MATQQLGEVTTPEDDGRAEEDHAKGDARGEARVDVGERDHVEREGDDYPVVDSYAQPDGGKVLLLLLRERER